MLLLPYSACLYSRSLVLAFILYVYTPSLPPGPSLSVQCQYFLTVCIAGSAPDLVKNKSRFGFEHDILNE